MQLRKFGQYLLALLIACTFSSIPVAVNYLINWLSDFLRPEQFSGYAFSFEMVFGAISLLVLYFFVAVIGNSIFFIPASAASAIVQSIRRPFWAHSLWGRVSSLGITLLIAIGFRVSFYVQAPLFNENLTLLIVDCCYFIASCVYLNHKLRLIITQQI